jgi:hypothetical protein
MNGIDMGYYNIARLRRKYYNQLTSALNDIYVAIIILTENNQISMTFETSTYINKNI